MFEKGRAYRFRPGRRGKFGSPAGGSRSALDEAVRYEYVSRERGGGGDILLFRSVRGRWQESFTPAQLGDFEITEAGR